MNIRCIARLGLCLALRAWNCGAQTTGVIEGVVLDPSSSPVRGGVVKLVETTTNLARTAETDERGRYLAPGLPPGDFRIDVTAAGFRTSVREEVRLSAGRTVRVDFGLQIGEVRETVTVQGGAALVSSSASDWGGTIDRQQLNSLPLNGRDVFDLAAQQPGVTAASHAEGAIFNGMGVQISVNGNRPNQNSFRMDGVYLNDGSSSAPASAAGRLLGVEGIEEIRLITNPFSAEFGKAAGAVLTAVSKGGGNEWHGSLYHYLRNNALDAKNFFDSPTDPIPPLRRNQFGGLFSGPVRANRIFFLANYEGILETRSRTQRGLTLSANGRQGTLPGIQVPVNPLVRPYLDIYPRANGRDFGDGTAEFVSEAANTNNEDYVSGRADFLTSSRTRTSAHVTFDNADNGAPDLLMLWKLRKYSRFLFVHSQTEIVQSPKTLHSFRFGYSRVRNNEDGDAPAGVPASLSFVPGRPIGQIQVTGLSEITDRTVGALPRSQALQDYQLNYDASHIRGAHTLRFGGGYDRLIFRQQADFGANGRYIFSSVQNLLRGVTRSGDLMSPESDTKRLWSQNQYFFGQDEWRPRPDLSVTMGVRYEGYTSPSEANGKIATLADPLRDTAMKIGGPLFDNPSATNFAPRVALAWRPTSSGRTVIRAGAGAFFDLLTSREVTIAGMRVPPFFNRIFLTAPAFPNLLAESQAGTPDKSLDGIAYAMEQPYVLQFRFAIQQQVGEKTAVEAGYSGSRGVHLIGQFGDVNIAQPQQLSDGRLFFAQGAPLRNPAFGRIGLRSSDFNSFYHALVMQVRNQVARGLTLQASYTWAKTIDDSSSSTNTEFDNSDRMPFPLNIRLQRGPADFDVRHVFTANTVWRIPGPTGGLVGHVAGGWELNGLAQAQTGFPFNPRIGFDRTRMQSGFGDLDQRPTLSASAPANIVLGDPAQYFNPAAFELPEAGFCGNLGRNTITGPGLFSLNLGLHKTVWRNERHAVRFRTEMFNVTNHPNFDIPTGLLLFGSTGARVGSAGQITSTSTTSRQIQLALRWAF